MKKQILIIFLLIFLALNIYTDEEIDLDKYLVETKVKRGLNYRLNMSDRENINRLESIIRFSLHQHFVYALIELENNLNKITNINGLPATEIKTALSNLLSRVKRGSSNEYKIKLVWMWDKKVISDTKTYPLSDFINYNTSISGKIGDKDGHGGVDWDASDFSATIYIYNAFEDFTYLAAAYEEECIDETPMSYKSISYRSLYPNVNSTNISGLPANGNYKLTGIKKFQIESALLHEFIHCALKESNLPNLSDPVYGRYRDEATVEDIMLKIYPSSSEGANFYEYTYNNHLHKYLFGGEIIPGTTIRGPGPFNFGYKNGTGLIRIFNPPNDLKYSKYKDDTNHSFLLPNFIPVTEESHINNYWCDDVSDTRLLRLVIPYKTCCEGWK